LNDVICFKRHLTSIPLAGTQNVLGKRPQSVIYGYK
jgi:hypothetical protein